MKRLLLLAGEESGVLYAKGIAEELRRMVGNEQLEIRGYADYGFTTAELAVFGFWAVLKRIFFFLRVKRTMERAIDEWGPEAVCTIDYPGMNLKLAAYAKARGIRAVHVVCPQVWAWKQSRIPKVEAAVDQLCCFLPFEPKLFKPGKATFVGHPLVDAFGKLKRESSTEPTIALLPGSRIGEIEKHLAIMLEAIKGLNVKVRIPAANARAKAAIERIAVGSGAEIAEGGARTLLMRADCAVVASGTATLEAALARCPTVLVYKVSPLLALLARRLIKGVKHVGLANVIWEKCGIGGEEPMPELLQENCTAANIRRYLQEWLEDANARKAAVLRLEGAMKLLEGGGAFAKIAQFLV